MCISVSHTHLIYTLRATNNDIGKKILKNVQKRVLFLGAIAVVGYNFVVNRLARPAHKSYIEQRI